MNSLNPIFLAFALIVCVYTVSRAWKTFADEEILSITNPMVKLIPFFVIVVAVGIRIYKFGEVPCGVMGDEAMIAINGKSLADYGIDIYGTRFPVHLNAWGQGQQSALLSYLMIPFIKFFGLSITVERIPILIISLLGMAALYFFTKDTFGERAALFVFSICAIMPWHIMQSR